ncbi:MAG: hypothetical protein SchgKO_23290 [Schleiferiaceae bacterium]
MTEEGGKEGIPQAVVTVLEGEVEIAKTQTDFEGKFSIYELEPGIYDVTVTIRGYKEYSFEGLHVRKGAVSLLYPVLIRENWDEIRIAEDPHKNKEKVE